MNTITERDPETVHDRRPTHATTPQQLAEARAEAKRLWERRDFMIDHREEYESESHYRQAMSDITRHAKEAEAWTQTVYDALNAQDECTCTADGPMCAACKAANVLRYGDEIPYK